MNDTHKMVYRLTMGQQRLIYWGDQQHTGFRLMESARSYRNIQRLENRERWKERVLGFVSGVLLSVIAWGLSLLV